MGDRVLKYVSDTKYFPTIQKKGKSPLHESNKISFNRIRAQNTKNIYWMIRNIVTMIFIFNLSITQNVLFHFCVGGNPKGLHLGYTNEEFLTEMNNCNSVPLSGCSLEHQISCRFLNVLEENSIVLTEFTTLEEGFSAVKKNDIWGLMYFPSNFTSSYLNRLKNQLRTSKEVGEFSEVKIWLDMSDQYIGTVLKRDVYAAFTEFQKYLYIDCGWPSKAASIPIQFNDAIYGTNKLNLTLYSAPALIALSQFFFSVLYTMASLVSEKAEGLVDRNIVAGLNILELIISHLYVQVGLLIIHTAIILFVNYVIFDNIMIGSWLLFLCLIVAIGIVGMCCATFLSAICSSDFESSVIGTGLFLCMTLTSGIMWPTEGMHYLIRTPCMLLPLNQPIEAYRAIAFRGWSITHPTVYLGFLACALWIAGFMLAAAAIYRWVNITRSK